MIAWQEQCTWQDQTKRRIAQTVAGVETLKFESALFFFDDIFTVIWSCCRKKIPADVYSWHCANCLGWRSAAFCALLSAVVSVARFHLLFAYAVIARHGGIEKYVFPIFKGQPVSGKYAKLRLRLCCSALRMLRMAGPFCVWAFCSKWGFLLQAKIETNKHW